MDYELKPAGDKIAVNIGWLNEFRQRHGHAPRILHIGNIANNAYNNAKILNQAGFDCDVLCPDYYHIMGCPEWEDADFSGDVRDQFRPDWHRLDLRGFKRPHWFAQGPFKLCTQYLITRRRDQQYHANRLWSRLASYNGIARPHSKFNIQAIKDRCVYGTRIVYFKLQDAQAVSRYMDRSMERLAKKLGGTNDRNLIKRYKLIGRGLLAPIRLFMGSFFALINLGNRSATVSDSGINQRVVSQFKHAFPKRRDQLSVGEVAYYAHNIGDWQELFKHYDVIQAYSTDVMYPMLSETPFIAFEHGTLREIPFENNATGRLTALGYHIAEAVLVTNSDCLDNAHALSTGAVRFINHPYDEDHGLRVEGVDDLRQTLCQELQADILIFFPTRQDWVADTGYADKANDVFLRGFAQLRKSGYAVGIVCCEWGSNVDQSKALLQELEVEQHVRWRQPMGIVRFERYVAACDLVADQFKLGAFGGVLFKAMSMGVPICTFIDEATVAGQFPEIPPVINCQTAEEVVNELEQLFRSRSNLTEFGRRGRAWIKAHHSAAQTVTIQAELYRTLLDKKVSR